MTDYVTKKDIDESLDKLAIKLIKHIDKNNSELRKDIEKIDTKYEKLVATLDAFIKRLDDIEANDAGRDVQLARHERWFDQISTKTGLKFVH